jgi:hypothetical protein
MWLALLPGALTFMGISQNTQAQVSEENPSIVSPDDKFRGLSYGEWGAQWWINLFGTPVVGDSHPSLQGGPFAGTKGVLFLAILSGGVTIDIKTPSGTPIFLPVVNTECSVFEPEPFHGDNEVELRACANDDIDHTSGLFAEIDGVPVNNLDNYRVESPLFQFTLPANNLFAYFGLDAPAGTTSPAVDAGVYLLLEPLTVGTHTIHVGGTYQDGFSFDTTFNITVVPTKK